jgi:hypothetical protein
MPESSFDHPLFGHVRFRTVSPEWKRGDRIVFISGFDLSDVTPVFVPQLENVPGSNAGKVRVHKRAHRQLLAVFKVIEARGQLHHIKTCGGTFNPRLRRPTSGALSRLPSPHAFGTAIDLNEDDPGFGASVAPVAPVFEAFGFKWGKSFNDPMHFEVNRLLGPDEVEGRLSMKYVATKQHVFNRGVAPDDFLDQLVAWGKQAPDEIFAPNAVSDIYSSVRNTLGPWRDLKHRRAAMLEVMRVLAGFESSWDWNEGPDENNPTSVTPETMEAGAWQVSANSMNFGQELKDLVLRHVGTPGGKEFQTAMKANHPLAMEYVARLLRRTTQHHGPVRDHEIDPWLRRDAVEEFEGLLLL